MRCVIIDYGCGNLHSVHKAVAAVAGQGDSVVVTSSPSDISNATHIILPGVGAFAACYDGLMRNTALFDSLAYAVLVKKIPFLGICVGMQLLATVGYEYGTHKGLDWIAGEVQPIPKGTSKNLFSWQLAVSPSYSNPHRRVNCGFPCAGSDSSVQEKRFLDVSPKQPQLKIPHMGWNNLNITGNHQVLSKDFQDQAVYFVHSYHFAPHDENVILATVDYGVPLVAAVASGNIIGVQFHPEKSGSVGLHFLQQFIKWNI